MTSLKSYSTAQYLSSRNQQWNQSHFLPQTATSEIFFRKWKIDIPDL